MADNISVKIGLDGEAGFKSALTAINAQIRALSSEMKASVAEMAGMEKSQEAITKKTQVLTKALQANEEKYKIINKQYQTATSVMAELEKNLTAATNEFGANSKEATKALNAYNAQVTAVERLKKEMNDSKAAIAEAKNGIKALGEGFDDASKKTSTFGDVLKANVLSRAIVDGVKALGGAIKNNFAEAIGLASDLQEVQNVVDTTFKNSAAAINDFSKSAAASFGIGEKQAKQFTGTIGSMFKSMGIGEKDILQMSTSITGLAGDMASFYNLDPEEAFAKLRSGISGETEPLKQLGINMSVANLEAYALAEGIKTAYKDMTQAEQATLRYNYIMQATADAQGDFAKTSESFANQQRVLALNLDNVRATIGSGVLPIVNKLTKAFNEWVSTIDWQSVSDAISNIFAWFVENGDYVLSVVVGIGTAFAAWNVAQLVQGVVQSIKAFKTANEAATLAQAALNAVMNANPFVLVGTLVAGLVAALMTLWATNDDFRKAVIDAWTYIKNAAVILFNGMKDVISTVAKNIGTFAINIKNSVVNAFTAAVDFIKSLPKKAVQWGKDFIQGLIDGIKSMISKVTSAVKGVADKIASFLHFSRPDVGPLRNYETWMPDMMKGLAKGMEANAYRIQNAAAAVAGNIAGGVTNNLGGVNITVNGAPGQSVTALADAVMDRIDAMIYQKQEVYR